MPDGETERLELAQEARTCCSVRKVRPMVDITGDAQRIAMFLQKVADAPVLHLLQILRARIQEFEIRQPLPILVHADLEAIRLALQLGHGRSDTLLPLRLR